MRRNDEGAAYVEFLVCFLPVFTMFLAMVQLGLMYAAKLTVGHSANRAARATMVVLDDDPDRYGNDPENQVAYLGAGLEATAAYGVGTVLAHWGIIGSAPDSTDGNGSARLRAIRSAASLPLVAMSPSLEQLGENKTVVRAVGGNAFGRLGTGVVLYNRGAVSVTFPESPRSMRFKRTWGNDDRVTVRVTYLFHCGVPIVSKWMCFDYVEMLKSVPDVILEQVVRRIAGDDVDRFNDLLRTYRDVRGRDSLKDGMEELGFAEAPYLLWPLLTEDSRFMILRAEASIPNHGAAYTYNAGADERSADRSSALERLRDDRGAMMVMGVFMATIVVAILYYVAGIGETIVYRERMQDAADAGAFAGATIHARAMNLVALLNTIMAAVFATVVAVRAAAFLLFRAANYAWSDCDPWSGRIQGCIAAPLLIIAGIQTCNDADSLESRAEQIIGVCEDVQEGLRVIAPIASAAKSFEIGSSTYDPPTDLGFAIAGFLPIEPDDDTYHCLKMIPHAAPWAAVHARREAPSIGMRYVNQAIGTDLLPMTALAASDLPSPIGECHLIKEKIKRVREDAEMGEDPFQVRSIMMGSPPFDENEERVAVATWGEDAGPSLGYSLLSLADRFAFAQGEFYYAVEGGMDRREWMWNMRWRARLRRFWLPGADEFGSSLCPAGLDCGTISRIIGVGDVVVH